MNARQPFLYRTSIRQMNNPGTHTTRPAEKPAVIHIQVFISQAVNQYVALIIKILSAFRSRSLFVDRRNLNVPTFSKSDLR